MSDLEVVKKNTLNECMHNLTLVEMRLMQLAIVDFRNKVEFDGNAIVEIHASVYAETFNVSRQTAHEAILEAEKTLFQRQFTFINDEGRTVKSRWIAHVEYADNSIKLGLSLPIIDAISRIDGKETPFTRYHIEQTHALNSRYSLRLYELVVHLYVLLLFWFLFLVYRYQGHYYFPYDIFYLNICSINQQIFFREMLSDNNVLGLDLHDFLK